jgi:putative membrane protein
MKKSLIMMGLILLAFAGTVKAQMQSPDTTARYFLIHASIGNLQEIVSGKLAMQKGTTPEIRAFGKMMVDDHGKAEEQLMQVAKSQGIMLPQAATEMPVADLNFKRAQGVEFDHLYVHAMVPGHRATLMMFRDYALTGKNPAVRAFARQTSPVIKKHLEEITTIDQNMK